LEPVVNRKLNKLAVGLPKHWIDVSDENADGPPTFINELYEEPGVLQISFLEYVKGEKPDSKYQDLIELSKNIGEKNEFGVVQNVASGDCDFGKYGFAQFSSLKFPYISVWHLTDGRDFILSTFICSKIPEKNEVSEVELILTSLKKAK